MKLQKGIHKILFAVWVLIFLLSSLTTAHKAGLTSEPESGLQMTISRYETEDGLLKTPKFKVELRNAGKNDLILNLGIMLANGRKQYPNAIVLILTDQDGKSRRLELRDPAVIAGRMDPLIVPLPVGSSYSLSGGFGQVLGSGFPGVRVQIKSWKLFSCDGISGRAVSTQSTNLDVKGIALMPYWEGTVCVKSIVV